MKPKQLLIPVITLLLITFTVVSAIMLYLSFSGPLDKTKNIIIYKNTSTKTIANNLYQEKIINYPKIFNFIAKIYAISGRYLKSGEYSFTEKITPIQVLNVLVSGKSVIHKITILEGETIHSVIDKLRNQEILVGEIDDNFTEGFLMPSTYFYSFGDSRPKLLTQMKQQMSDALDKLMPLLSKDSPLKTRLDVLTLASIVEKEALLDYEKPIIASVFLNRLNKNMKLQADPTTIYAITMGKSKFTRPITKSDLQTSSAYNTYYTHGLPPSPIACPGIKAIEAVIKPSLTNYLYFVVNGSGGHNFSQSLTEHNNNVLSYRKSRSRNIETKSK